MREEEKQQKRGRRSPRSPEESNFRSRFGIVEQNYLEAIPELFVLRKRFRIPPKNNRKEAGEAPGAPRKAISGVGLES